MSRLLLKARPVEPQLADRLRAPRPDGLELYLDTVDVASESAMDAALRALASYELPSDFALLIEGPIRSLDGEFFDLGRASEADREVIRRLAKLAQRLGARAVNIHVIAPTGVAEDLSERARWTNLERAVEPIRFFADLVLATGAVPTIENMPPVLRMRESSFYFSPIGMPAEDLIWLCQRVPGLRTTLDLSHAGLYLNCRREAEARATVANSADEFTPLMSFVRRLPAVKDVQAYAETLGSTLLTCHVSNATGLLGEGEPYDRGDLDLDRLITSLAERVTYFVTETLEIDRACAVEMRRALTAMRRALQAAA